MCIVSMMLLVWGTAPQPAGRLEAIQVRHGDIQEGHLRRMRVGQPQGLRAIGGLTHTTIPACSKRTRKPWRTST